MNNSLRLAEAGLNHASSTISLTPEQIARLTLQPPGGGLGDFPKRYWPFFVVVLCKALMTAVRFANPTPLGIASFVIVVTSLAGDLLGFKGTTSASLAVS
jgi:hypothetical protein